MAYAPGMLETFAMAEDLAAMFPGRVNARIIDADSLLEAPGRVLASRTPRNIVEILIDGTGVIIVATGRDRDHPLYWRLVHIPQVFAECGSLDRLCALALRTQLLWHARCGMEAIDTQPAPRARRLLGP